MQIFVLQKVVTSEALAAHGMSLLFDLCLYNFYGTTVMTKGSLQQRASCVNHFSG